MLAKTENERLTQVGPGTPMGELLRRYWHPVAASHELDLTPFRTKPVRVLGEDLVLYRDRGGNLGLIGRYCAHRRVDLTMGVAEEDGLRCPYHGWKFNADGRCVEQPFEDTLHPDGAFREKCPLAGYPVQEAAGLVFAYLGPRPAPAFPLWEPFGWDNVVRDIAITELPCSWLQCQENSLDPVHVEWLHGYFGKYASEIMGNPTFVLGARSLRHQKIGFDVFDYGIVKRRILEGQTEDDPEWKHGHPILFPNVLFVGSKFSATLQFRVPIDDARTYHVSLYTYRAAPGSPAPEQAYVPFRLVPLHHPDGSWILDYVFNQDYMAWISQGEVAQRDLEKLGESDRGIILFRRMLREQMQRVKNGRAPMNVFEGGSRTPPIPLPLEPVKFGQERPGYRAGEAGDSEDADLIRATLATWYPVLDMEAPEPDERVAVTL